MAHKSTLTLRRLLILILQMSWRPWKIFVNKWVKATRRRSRSLNLTSFKIEKSPLTAALNPALAVSNPTTNTHQHSCEIAYSVSSLLSSMQSGMEMQSTTGNSWYVCKWQACTYLNTIIFPQLEHALAVISKIEDGPIAQDARRGIIKLRKLTVYDSTSGTLSLPLQFTTTLAILLLPA